MYHNHGRITNMRLLVPMISLLLACVVADHSAARMSEDMFTPKDYALMNNVLAYVYDDQENLVKLTLKDDEEDDDKKLNDTLINIENRVFFFLHTKNASREGEQLYVGNDEVLKNSKFDPKKPTNFVTHGWQNSRNSSACTLICNAYMKQGDYNVIIIDWSSISMNLYVWASKRVKMVAMFVSDMINFLVRHGLDPSQISLVGHSLGAHVSGLAARYYYSRFYRRVNYVVGLDPALPGFYLAGPGSRVSSGDANYVAIIHTNGGLLGFLTAIGDVDFFPNGGTKQIGCLIDIGGACSHARSYKFFAESITSNVGFHAKSCSTFIRWSFGLCRDQDTSLMGGTKPVFHTRGNYFLKTRPTFPFAKGIRGVKPMIPSIVQGACNSDPSSIYSNE